MRCAYDLEELIATETCGRIAAFIAEPILGVGGFIFSCILVVVSARDGETHIRIEERLHQFA